MKKILKKYKKIKVLVIGGQGYIGSVLCEDLIRKNLKIISVDNRIYNQKIFNDLSKNKNYKNYSLSISNKQKILHIAKDSDYIIFLASAVGDPITKKYPQISTKINEKFTLSLLKGLSKSSIKKLIYISTCSNYGVSKKVVRENSILRPLSVYAKNKVMIEKFLLKNKNAFNFPIIILRFATAFGWSSRMRFDLTINEFVRNFVFKKNFDLYDTFTWRPYCHVKDFSRIIYKVAIDQKFMRTDVLNVGSNANNFTKHQIVEKIEKYLKKPMITIINKSKVDRRNYKVNFSKLKKLYKIYPKYSVDYGIKEIISKIKKNPKKFLNKKKFGNYEIKKFG